MLKNSHLKGPEESAGIGRGDENSENSEKKRK